MKRYINCAERQRRKYTLNNGKVIYSYLTPEQLNERYIRLDDLRILVEDFEGEPYEPIYKKAVRALNANPFTGIIHLSFAERDALGYLLERDTLSSADVAVLNYYLKLKG